MQLEAVTDSISLAPILYDTHSLEPTFSMPCFLPSFYNTELNDLRKITFLRKSEVSAKNHFVMTLKIRGAWHTLLVMLLYVTVTVTSF